MKKLIVMLMAAFAFGLFSAQADVERADQLFEEARSVIKEDISKGRVLYEAAALEYLSEANQSYIGRGVALYNAGNAFAMAGIPGRAVIAYRKAQRYLPELEYLNDNLNQVRNLVGSEVKEPATGLWSKIMAWDKSSWGLRLAYLALAYFAFWALLIRGLWTDRHMHRGLGAAVMIAISALSISILSDIADWQKANEGVVVVRTVDARKGEGYGYHAAFQSPLREGTEFKVLETRGEWLRVTLSEDSTCWLPIQAVELF